MSISFRDAKRQEIKSWNLTAIKGLNQVRSDLVVKTVDSAEPYFFDPTVFVPAGTYGLRLAGDGIALQAKLLVAARPQAAVGTELNGQDPGPFSKR